MVSPRYATEAMGRGGRWLKLKQLDTLWKLVFSTSCNERGACVCSVALFRSSKTGLQSSVSLRARVREYEMPGSCR